MSNIKLTECAARQEITMEKAIDCIQEVAHHRSGVIDSKAARKMSGVSGLDNGRLNVPSR